jgi:hypothetical protein
MSETKSNLGSLKGVKVQEEITQLSVEGVI